MGVVADAAPGALAAVLCVATQPLPKPPHNPPTAGRTAKTACARSGRPRDAGTGRVVIRIDTRLSRRARAARSADGRAHACGG